MKKRTLILLFVSLTIVLAMISSGVAFADDGTAVDGVPEFTRADTIRLIIVYCAFGLSLIVGIPALRAIKKRKKRGYVDDIVKATEAVSKKLHEFYLNRGSASKTEILKYSVKIMSVGDMALTTYTEKQIGGYYDLFNRLNGLRTSLTSMEKGDEEEFNKILQEADSIHEAAKLLAANEKIVREYRG